MDPQVGQTGVRPCSETQKQEFQARIIKLKSCGSSSQSSDGILFEQQVAQNEILRLSPESAGLHVARA